MSLRLELEQRGLEVLQERLYLAPGAADAVLGVRTEVLAGTNAGTLPSPTILVNQPCLDVPCAGLHYLAVKPSSNVKVQSLHQGESGPGRKMSWDKGTALFLPSDPASASGSSIKAMFRRVEERLAAEGMSLRDVARTWLYLRDLLDDYDELNRVRDEFFTNHGLGDSGRFDCPPASTGIQAFHRDGRASFMEALAVQSAHGDRPFQTVQPELQCEAWDYGSSFSRGMVIDLGGSSLTSLSGTASIGTDGTTMHLGHSHLQIQQTLKSFENLLTTCEKPTRPAGLWTLYFKNQETWKAWREGVQGGLFEPIDGPAIYADVCRDNLLFEMELTLAT